VLGDVVYSKPRHDLEKIGMALCAQKLAFTHPFTGEMLNFEIKLPFYFQKMVEEISLLTIKKYEVLS
jgi:23S rRNA pseudouridine1911/1915/1917 synthase